MPELKYIIIGELPARQKNYLLYNVEKEMLPEETIIICDGLKKAVDDRFDESILISANPLELRDACEKGMATLAFLQAGYEGSDVYGIVDMCAEGLEEVGITFLIHTYERHHNIPWTILTTERCVVKEFSMEYLDALFELYEGEGMTEYMEPLYPYEQEKEYQEAYIRCMYGFYGYGMWIICDKMTGKLIGRAGVEHREELDGEMELGYAIGVPHQRQGYATEVCIAILNYVKKELLQEKISCLIEAGNIVSEEFAKKLGFAYEKELQLGEKTMKKFVLTF